MMRLREYGIRFFHGLSIVVIEGDMAFGDLTVLSLSICGDNQNPSDATIILKLLKASSVPEHMFIDRNGTTLASGRGISIPDGDTK